MDFKAVIGQVKYTLALAAACFAYALEKLVPAANETARWFALAVLLVLFLSLLGGGFIFSAATAALHGDSERAVLQQGRIKRAAFVHLGFLALGVLLLGGKLFHQVLTEIPTIEAAHDRQ